MQLFKSQNRKTLFVPYPNELFIADGRFSLDPENLYTIYEFYLLENLGIGLVKDDVQAPLGFSPVLADAWQRIDGETWRFKIKEDLYWSDGTSITLAQIRDHLYQLKAGKSLHITHLKFLKSIDVDAMNNSLTLYFTRSTEVDLLHELSLADAVLVHPYSKNWSVTSGPYFVKKISDATISLEANLRWIGHDKDFPQQISLIDWLSIDFATYGRDYDNYLLDIPAPQIGEKYKEARKYGKRHLGVANTIYFAAFEPHSAYYNQKPFRKLVADVFNSTMALVKIENSFKRENQMIPSGYSGRLQDKPVVNFSEELSHGNGAIVTLGLRQPFSEWPEFTSNLKIVFAKAGYKLEIDYFDMYAKSRDNRKKSDITIYAFVGNQVEALGSWSYLYAERNGPLRSFSNFFNEVVKNIDFSSKRDEYLESLHRKTLEEFVAIPLFIGQREIIAHESLDLSRWNKFDMRLRFYDIRYF